MFRDYPRFALVLSVIFLSTLSFHARASFSPKIYRDELGMVRCFSAQDQIGWSQDVLLTWSETDRYQKTVTAHPLANSFINQNGVGGDSTGWFQGRTLTCDDWKTIRNFNYEVSGDSEEVGSSTTEIFGLSIPPEAQTSIAQVSLGGSALRETDDPSAFLTALTDRSQFSLDDNIHFSKAYGTPFSGEIYRTWVHEQPFNRDLELDLYWQMKHPSGASAIEPSSLRGLKIIVVDGFGGGLRHVGDLSPEDRADPHTPPFLMGDVLDLLNAQGFNAEGIRTAPYGKIEENSALIEAALTRALNENSKVVFVSLSRGMAETLSAIAQIRKTATATGTLPQLEGRIAVLSLSGLIKGSLIADFLSSNKLLCWFGHLLQQITGTTSDGNPLINGKELSVEHISALYQENLAYLPKDLPVWNLVGIVPRMESRFRNLHPYWDEVARVNQPNRGDHDGLIEYPLMEVPRGDFARARTLVFDSTHYLVDGEFMTFDLTQPVDRVTVFRTLLLNFIQYSFNADGLTSQ